MERPLLKPKRLYPGDTIGLVAPAGKVDHNALHAGVASLEALGYRVVLGRQVEKAHRYFAGHDRDRAADFLEMMQNPDVHAVFCARGGYGSARLLPYLDRNLPNKILVGSSDITTLLLYIAQLCGAVTFHGPMVATESWSAQTARDTLFQILSGEAIVMHTPEVRVLRSGPAEGILTGGCLSLMVTTIGTPYEIDTDDTILFLEDVGEAAYRIDRMLSYLKAIKKFDKVRGVVFGQMPKCEPDLLPEIILDILAPFDFPILFNFPSGHGRPIFTLPLGVPMRVETEKASLTMLAPAVAT